MSRQLLVLLAIAMIAFGAGAESRASRLAKAHEKLKANDAAGAIELLRELQVEEPGDEHVRYALGCAQYKQAEAQQEMPGGRETAGGDAATLYHGAEEQFGALTSSSDARIAQHAAFDRANCLTQMAKLSLQDPKAGPAAVGALRSAASAYEDYLRRYPDDKNAQQNLDHVRFLMKKLQRQDKDKPKDENKQDQKKDDSKQPPAVLSVRNAQTELPGAHAVVGEDSTVRLVKPGAPGATP